MSCAVVAPDFITFDSSISACEKGEQWGTAIQLLKGMVNAKVERIVACLRFQPLQASQTVCIDVPEYAV